MSLLRNARLLLILSPYMDRIGKECSMPISWHVVFQVVAMLIQAANALLPMLPPNGKIAVTLGVGAVQALLAFVAHFTNPDGTPAPTTVANAPPEV